MQASDENVNASTVPSHEGDIQAWVTDVAQGSVFQGESAPSASEVPSAESELGTRAHEQSEFRDPPIPGSVSHTTNEHEIVTTGSGASAEQPVRYFVLKSPTRAAIMQALNTSARWPVSAELGERMKKTVLEGQAVIAFLCADDTRQFVACAYVTGVKASRLDVLIQASARLINLSELVAAGKRSSMSSLGSGPSSNVENLHLLAEYKERALEASIWNLTKEEMAIQRHKERLMAKLMLLRQQPEAIVQLEGVSTDESSPSFQSGPVKRVNKMLLADEMSGQESSANEGDSKGTSLSSHSPREKDGYLRRTAHSQAWRQASALKTLAAEAGMIKPTTGTPLSSKALTAVEQGSESKTSLRANVPSDADSPRRVSSTSNSNVGDTAHSSSTPETSNNAAPAGEPATPGMDTAALVSDSASSAEFESQAEMRKIEASETETSVEQFIVLDALLTNPLPFSTIAEEQIRNNWHSTFSLRQQRGRLVYKVPDGTELAPGTGHDLLALWTESEETPICPMCGRHWPVPQSGMEESTTESDVSSDSPSDNDEDDSNE